MTYIILILFCIIVAGLLCILPFIGLPTLQTNTTFIASYGSYLAGTIAPFISFIALIALLKTIHVQQKQLVQSGLESQKNSLHFILNKLEEKLDNDLMRHEIEVGCDGNKYSFSDLIQLEYFGVFYEKYIPKYNLKTDSVDLFEVKKMEVLKVTDLNLLRLAEIVMSYDRLCEKATMKKYYSAKYHVLINRLDKLHYLNETNKKYWLS
ncbi:hypothetical protein CTM85_16515 [Photobacterium phosphoreum]|nr:hypothetical protein CTM85_16515 [Photobacterium phosphoreum]